MELARVDAPDSLLRASLRRAETGGGRGGSFTHRSGRDGPIPSSASYSPVLVSGELGHVVEREVDNGPREQSGTRREGERRRGGRKQGKTRGGDMLGGEAMLRNFGIIPLHELEVLNGVGTKAEERRTRGAGASTDGEERGAGAVVRVEEERRKHELLAGLEMTDRLMDGLSFSAFNNFSQHEVVAVRRRDGSMCFASIYRQLPGGLVDLTLHEPSDGAVGPAAKARANGSRARDRHGGDEVGGPPRMTANPWVSPTGAWTYHHGHIAADMPYSEAADTARAAGSKHAQGRVRKIVPVWQVGKLGEASTELDFRLPSEDDNV